MKIVEALIALSAASLLVVAIYLSVRQGFSYHPDNRDAETPADIRQSL